MTPATRNVRQVIERVVEDGAVAAREGAVHNVFPVAVSAAEGEALRKWVQREDATRTIEIGLGYGLSALFICEGLLANGHDDARHVAVDPYQASRFENCGLQVLDEAGLRDLVEHHAEESQIALPQLLAEGRRFDLAFVDGNHRFDGVFLDLAYLGRLVRPGGIVLVDDYQLPAVARAASFFLSNLGWSLEEVSDADELHHWAALRTSLTADARSFDHFVEFQLREESFELPVGGGAIRGHRAGSGHLALLLHGGAAVPDYLGDCARTLDGLFETVRYTQRGTPPSEAPPPYTIESHMIDALAVLDLFEIERAWAIGHSWGGHLALHLLVAHPNRIAGVLCIDALGAEPGVFVTFEENRDRTLTAGQIARIHAIEELRRSGAVSEAELVERFALGWPAYFHDPEQASAPPERVGREASIETNRSLAEHFERRTLIRRLPEVRAPALFVHGESDPLPPESSTVTAALIPGALVETIPDCGHFPWLEQPAAFRSAVEGLLARVRA